MSVDAKNIEVRFDRSGLGRADQAALRRHGRSILGTCIAELGWEDSSLNVLFCSAAEIQRLNREFRAIDKPTDVLSFPDDEALDKRRDQAGRHLGDIAICFEVCAAQAREARRKAIDEVALLLVHGLLHLLGHDHDTAARKKIMWRETDRLLALCKEIKAPKLEAC